MTQPKVFLDTEFSNSHKGIMDVICVSMSVWRSSTGLSRPTTFWVNGYGAGKPVSLKEVASLTATLNRLKDEGAIFYAYLASAECRALQSLGYFPMGMNWICLYSEWRQLNHNNHKHMYGRYLRKGVTAGAGGLLYGVHGYSTPPSLIAEDNEGKDNTQVGNSYADVCYHLLGEVIDTKHKDQMRDICIRGSYAEIEKHRKEISEYCESDIKHLPALAEQMETEICQNFRLSQASYMEIAQTRGEFAGPVTGRIEANGIPVDLDAINNLISNVSSARDALVHDYYRKVDVPFLERVKRTLKDFKAPWCDRYQLFADYVDSLGVEWPTTDSGRYSKEDDDLSEFDSDPNIFHYRQVKKALKGLESFDPDSASAKRSGIITNSIDPADQRLRLLFGIFGTMTGRNAPKARRFIFAMGRWARSLVKAPKDHVIVAMDWSSQEFAIAAALSGDENMMDAYKSGDPYMWFAIAAGAAPKGATKKTHKEERTLFKSTTLGLQYGMGVAKLARKLTIDTGRPVSEKEARKLIDLHRKIYKKYWRWAKGIVRTYKSENCLVLKDGWGLNANCERETTVRNFPVQGTGAVILRRATVLAIRRGLPIVAPLHDALYGCPHKDDELGFRTQLSACMTQAVHEVLGNSVDIRIDVEVHRPSEEWVEEGAEDIYKALTPFMEEYRDINAEKAEKLKTLLS